jgi:hypothetical protein
MHTNTPCVLILSQINPVYTTPPYLYKIDRNVTHSLLPSGLFLFCFPTNNICAFLFSPIRATWHAHLILRDLITLIVLVLGEEHKRRSSSLCSLLNPPVTSSLFGPNITFSTLFLNTLGLYFSLNVRDKVSRPYRTTGKIIDRPESR